MRRTAAWGVIASAPILSSCGGSGSGSPAASTTTTQFQPLPNNAAGTQLRWVLSAVAYAPLPAQEIHSHFDAAFLTKILRPPSIRSSQGSHPLGSWLACSRRDRSASWRSPISGAPRVDGDSLRRHIGLIQECSSHPLRLQPNRHWAHSLSGCYSNVCLLDILGAGIYLRSQTDPGQGSLASACLTKPSNVGMSSDPRPPNPRYIT